MASIQMIPSSTSTSGGSENVAGSSSSSGPYAPQYLSNAENAINNLTTSAASSAEAQKKRLLDFVNNLGKLRLQVMNQAKGAAAKGASGMQNPLAVARAVQELSNQAGVPLQANIAQALMQGQSIENTMNQLLADAAHSYIQMSSIPSSQSSSFQRGNSGGGSVIKLGGGKSESGPPQKGYSMSLQDTANKDKQMGGLMAFEKYNEEQRANDLKKENDRKKGKAQNPDLNVPMNAGGGPVVSYMPQGSSPTIAHDTATGSSQAVLPNVQDFFINNQNPLGEPFNNPFEGVTSLDYGPVNRPLIMEEDPAQTFQPINLNEYPQESSGINPDDYGFSVPEGYREQGSPSPFSTDYFSNNYFAPSQYAWATD